MPTLIAEKPQPTPSQPKPSVDYGIAFPVVTSLFFAFGLLTCLNDVLVPHLKALFTLSYAKAALVQFCFFAAYFAVSLPSGKLVFRLGYKRGIIVGTLGMAAGCLLFYPAATLRSYGLFLTGLFVLASGMTLLQVSANPYVAILGPSEHASSRLNLAQAFNSLGTTIAPLFGAYLILSAAASVQSSYLGLAAALVALSAVVGLVRLPAMTGSDEQQAGPGPSLWESRALVLGAVGIFAYVGAEVAIGSYLVNFMGLPEIGSLAPSVAAPFVSLYWGGAMLGRFIGSAALKKIRPGRALAFNALAAAALTVAAMAFGGRAAMAAILSIGLFNSIMFPTIFTLAIDGLGAATAQASGVLCMAIVGGAVIPLAQGALADAMGLHHSFVLPVVCYLFVAYYGLAGGRSAGRR